MSKVTRLFNSFKPSRYELHLYAKKIGLTFGGKVKVFGLLEQSNKNLILHCKDLNVIKVQINESARQFKIDVAEDHLIVEVLPKDCGNLVAEIEFKGNITEPMHGLYPCTGRDGDIILATQFESHHAREVFPCIDEPEAKAIFSIRLDAPKDDVVISNTSIVNEIVYGNEKTCEFYDTPLMSTYLLAFVIGKLNYQEAVTHDGVNVRAWATPDQEANTGFALEIAVKSLEFFNDYFEIPYPLNKCDIVALPDFAAGAMENWGLLTFRETCMLVDPANTSLDYQQYVAMVVAHEVAHQWFGNLVTMRWWNDLWLNEGFASWIEFMAIDKIFPDWHMWTQFIASEQHTAFRLDSLKNTHAIEVDVPDPNLIPTIFDGISYSKGACMIHMLHEYLGKNNFRLGLAHYLKKYSYKNTETSDLWDALSDVSHMPVAKFMGAWTSEAGFPFISLKINDDNLELSQKRFLASGKEIKSPAWPIPLLSPNIDKQIFDTYDLKVKMHGRDNIRLNANQAGFYITKYWPEAYKNMVNQIGSNQLKETERAGLVADMLALTKAGRLSAVQLLDVIQAFDKETSSPVWDGVATVLGDLRHVLDNEVRQSIKPLTRQLVQSQLDRLGWQENINESHFDKLLRPLILGLASGADNQAVIQEAKKRFFGASTISNVSSNLRGMIISSVSHRGGESEFLIMLNMLKNASSPEDKVTLAHGLTNFRQPAQYNEALKLIKSNYVRLQDVHHWIIYSLNNPESRDSSWIWVKNNWAWLKHNFGSDMSYSRLPVYVARCFNDEKRLIEYKSFFGKVHEPSLDRGIKQGIETIESQIAWRKRDEKAVLEWLKKRSA